MNDYHIFNLLIILLIHVGIVVRCSENVDQVQSMVLARIKKDGFSPDFIIDCGANVGKWTRSISKIFPDVSILMLEGKNTMSHNDCITCTSYQNFKCQL